MKTIFFSLFTGQRKKRAAPLPPVARLPSAISSQGLERIVDSDESLTSDIDLSKPSSDIVCEMHRGKASSDIVAGKTSTLKNETDNRLESARVVNSRGKLDLIKDNFVGCKIDDFNDSPSGITKLRVSIPENSRLSYSRSFQSGLRALDSEMHRVPKLGDLTLVQSYSNALMSSGAKITKNWNPFFFIYPDLIFDSRVGEIV